MTPPQWYARGVRLLGRTAVECTRDPLADRIGHDVATMAASVPPETQCLVVDPFAGSCNTLYWILRHPEPIGMDQGSAIFNEASSILGVPGAEPAAAGGR
jgi:hypothetical protein